MLDPHPKSELRCELSLADELCWFALVGGAVSPCPLTSYVCAKAQLERAIMQKLASGSRLFTESPRCIQVFGLPPASHVFLRFPSDATVAGKAAFPSRELILDYTIL